MAQLRWWSISALALTLLFAGVPARAQESGAATPEIEEQAMSTLKRMADFLSQAQSFSVTAEIGFDVVQDSGQKLEFGETREMVIRRPDHARINTTKRDGSRSGFVYNGQEIAIFNVEEEVYATVAKPGTLDDAVFYFVNNLDMRLPLAEFFSSRLSQMLSERVQSARYVEPSHIAGVPCDHLALRSDRADMQVWVAKGDQPLPQRIVITYTHAVGQPQFWAQFSEWNLSPEAPNSLFAFTPPEGASKIVFAPRRGR